jgi:hypothetical protein
MKVIIRKVKNQIIAIFPEQRYNSNRSLCKAIDSDGIRCACGEEWIENGDIPTIDECVQIINQILDIDSNIRFVRS